MKQLMKTVIIAGLLVGHRAPALAVTFSIAGDVGTLPAGSTTGTLQVVYDPAPEGVTFANGGIRIEVNSSASGVIRFTSAEVINGGRWTAVQAVVRSEDKVEVLEGFSILTPGLPGDQSSVYATINYEVIAPGTTEISAGPTAFDPLCDCGPGVCECDPAKLADYVGAAITVVPEPTSGLLGGIACLASLALRLRGSPNTR